LCKRITVQTEKTREDYSERFYFSENYFSHRLVDQLPVNESSSLR
jgi:hypothetical protein